MQDSLALVARRAPRQGRRRVPAHRHRHVPGDRAERVLRVRRHVPDQQRRRQPAARRAGDVLPGPRRLQPRRSASGASALYAQDEWRVASRVTVNYGLRYERINPFTEVEDRLNALRAGAAVARSGPTRRAACCSPATPASARASRTAANAFMPRVGRRLGSDRRRRLVGARELRALLRSVPERRRHRVAGGDQRHAVRRSSTSSAAPASTSRTRISGARFPAPNTFVRPVDRLRARRRRQAAVGAELERSACSARCSAATSSRSATSARPGTTPAAQRRSEPGRLRSRRDGAERRPPPHLRQLPGRRRHLRLLDHRDAAQHHAARRYHAGQFSLSRRFGAGVGFNVSYWYRNRTTTCRR